MNQNLKGRTLCYVSKLITFTAADTQSIYISFNDARTQVVDKIDSHHRLVRND